MALIQKGMSINCRTQDELQVFAKIAVAEGHYWISGNAFDVRGYNAPISFQIGYFKDGQYPQDISYTEEMDFTGEDELENTLTIVEASDLFRNHLISRRVKHGQSMGTE